MQIRVNDYEEHEHFRAICEDCYNVSRTCGYDRLRMSHIHNTCEILLVETGEADYYISGKWADSKTSLSKRYDSG